MNSYVVATIKDWNIKEFNLRVTNYSGEWHLITHKLALNIEFLRRINPQYIFFPHWSWLVPKEILSEFNCVCFHMTDLPYGRGGSPLQNLIIRGHQKTQLSALKMEKTLDTGPIYLKKPLSLAGSAQEIYSKSASLTFDMIEDIIKNNYLPTPQEGEIVNFERRIEKQSEVDSKQSIKQLYDFIRMLDADSYPHAFICHGKYKLEFTNVSEPNNNTLNANVKFTMLEQKND